MSKECQIDILLVFFWHWQWCQGAPKAMAPMPECPKHMSAVLECSQTQVTDAGPPSAPVLLLLDGFFDQASVG